jgi:uncharacterized protein YsxB (DUF464 family)
MVNLKRIGTGIVCGAISGIIMGLFLKLIEHVTDIKVYTLLLNVDFLPFLKGIELNEYVEFSLHLFISIFIGIIYACLSYSDKRPFSTSFILVIPTIFLYFPLTTLALKETPLIDDYYAFFWWTLGHALYAFSLAISCKRATV